MPLTKYPHEPKLPFNRFIDRIVDSEFKAIHLTEKTT